MLRNHLIIALRNIKKYKGYAVINLTGLAIGVASCLLILLFVQSELRYDGFHKNFKRIYRAGFKFHVGSNQFDTGLGPSPLSEALLKNFPEIQNAARIFARQSRGGDVFVRYKDRRFQEKRFFWADASIFEILTFEFISGNPNEALKKPNSVVLTSKTAAKYFGTEEAIGKILILEDDSSYLVTGVCREWPWMSHFNFDFLASFSTLSKSRDPDFYDTAVFTYLLLHENSRVEGFEAKLPEFSGKCMSPIIEKIMAVEYEEFLKSGNYIGFMLQPLSDIHLRSDWGNELEPQGSITIVIIFSAVAVLILLVACINFINLSTARSSQRSNEVGIRKVVGSTRMQLVRQFLTESILFSFLGVILAMLFVEISLPAFNNIIGRSIHNVFFDFSPNLLYLIPGVILVGIAAGAYPAFLISSFQPVSVLKGNYHSGLKNRGFRSILVIFQFCTSIILLIGTTVIYSQLHYIRNKELGFEKEHVVIIQRAEKLGMQQEAFKNQLLENPKIMSSSFTDSLPQLLIEAKVFQKEGEGGQENNTLMTITSDYDFFETYQIKMIEGRSHDRERLADSTAIVLNETAIKSLQISNPLESRLVLVGMKRLPMDIIGICEDFHMESLYTSIGPTAVILSSGRRPGVLLSIRILPGNLGDTLNFIENRWNQFTNHQPFEYTFFDTQFDGMYQTEIRSGKVISAFSGLAVFIACLGLLGLASFTVGQKTKEIGIRKVLGASVVGIILLLNRELGKRVLIANLIAWPAAYYLVQKWLQNFAYRIQIGVWIFIASSLFTFLLAIFTVSFLSLKAAQRNPVRSLRYE